MLVSYFLRWGHGGPVVVGVPRPGDAAGGRLLPLRAVANLSGNFHRTHSLLHHLRRLRLFSVILTLSPSWFMCWIFWFIPCHTLICVFLQALCRGCVWLQGHQCDPFSRKFLLRSSKPYFAGLFILYIHMLFLKILGFFRLTSEMSRWIFEFSCIGLHFNF